MTVKEIAEIEGQQGYSDLIRAVEERGEHVILTRGGRPVAEIRTAARARVPLADVIARMDRRRRECRLAGLSVRELREEGRRF